MSRDDVRSWEGRCWVDASPIHVISKGLPTIRFLSYRLLAHYKTAYINHSAHKGWEYRSKVLIQELACYDADVICFQDVDMFQEFWYPRLMSMGYDMVFKRRTQVKEYCNEGVLTAFRRDRFQLFRTVEIEFNDAVTDDSKGTTFRERCQTDDVGLILFLQPNKVHDLACSLCVGNAMLNESVHYGDVRAAHMEYFTAQIELSNREFHAPVLLGLNLNDVPASSVYTLLRTGRKALTAAVPLACSQVTATSTCRGSALVQWLPPKGTIADSPITAYQIAWRPGGSSTLGFSLQKTVTAGDCIHYSEHMDERGRKKITADVRLQYTIAGLSSDMVYEFCVRGVNDEGEGMWSEASAPIVLPNPVKAPKLPALDPTFFAPLPEVVESRERERMADSDWNINLAMRANPLNAPTQLTPRLVDEGRINYEISRSRALPALDGTRNGWKEGLQGIPAPALTAEMTRDGVLHRSALRDKQGYKDRQLNSLQYSAQSLQSQNEADKCHNLHETQPGAGYRQHYPIGYSIPPTSLQLHQAKQHYKSQRQPAPIPLQAALTATIHNRSQSSKSVLFHEHRPNNRNNSDNNNASELESEHSLYGGDSISSNNSSVYLMNPGSHGDTDIEQQLLHHVANETTTSHPSEHIMILSPGAKEDKDSSLRFKLQQVTSSKLLKAPAVGTFAQLNPVALPLTHLAANNAVAKAWDGGSLMLDAREVLHHLGAGHPRSRHGLMLRSAYETCGGVCGEPVFGAAPGPQTRNTFGSETLDYIFYSAGMGLVATRCLSLPSVSTLLHSGQSNYRGATPEAPLLSIDTITAKPHQMFVPLFDSLVQDVYARTYQRTRQMDHDDDDDYDEEEIGFEEGNEEQEPDTRTRAEKEAEAEAEAEREYLYQLRGELQRLLETTNDDDHVAQHRNKLLLAFRRQRLVKRERRERERLQKRAEKRRAQLDVSYTANEVQTMKQFLKTALKKSHALDDQSTELAGNINGNNSSGNNTNNGRNNTAKNKGNSTTTGGNFVNRRNQNNNAPAPVAVLSPEEQLAAEKRARFQQYKDRVFWGGQWQGLPAVYPHRQNAYLPNARFPSTHWAMGVDLVVNEDLLPTKWSGL